MLIQSLTAYSLFIWHAEVGMQGFTKGGGGGVGVALQALKKEGEAGILAREDVENRDRFRSFPFFSLLVRPSRSHAPRSRVPLPLLKLPRRLLLGN